MDRIITVAICRHPQKDPGGADAITPHGAMQAYASAQNLVNKLGHKPDIIYHSGLNRAFEAARVMATAMGIERELKVNDGLDFQPTAHQICGENPKLVLVEKAKFDDECGGIATLAHALKHSEYARRAAELVERAISEMAADANARGLDTVLAVSHSPWFDCAAMHENAIYGLPEAAAIVWRVSCHKSGNFWMAKILDSIYIEPPLPGKRN